ncbi:hypothetical protein BBP40_006868 [Aspergillus hancockii]|nr:hypothetical protein BBP40_006868 [Aspergillus hancockii]
MKFTFAASSFIAAALAASLPESFTLVADGGNTVLTDGTHAIVDASQASTLEILRLQSGGSGAITYTRQGSPPTAWQNLYVIKDDTQPIALTIPHSGNTPDGAELTGFSVTEDGYLTFNGETSFGLSAENKEIYYLGKDSETPKVSLWVKELKQ